MRFARKRLKSHVMTDKSIKGLGELLCEAHCGFVGAG